MSARPRTVHGIDLTAPGGIARLLAFRRQRHGGLMMTAPTGEQEAQGEQEAGQEGGGLTQAEQDQVVGERIAADEKRFSQADFDAYAARTRKALEAKAQKAIDDAAALAGKSETEKLQAQLEQANSRAVETAQKAAQRVARTEARGAARDLGARPERLDAVLKQADLTAAIGDDGEVDDAKVKAAVDKVLTEYPEWKKTTHTGPSSSGGELNGGGNGKPTFTRKQLEEMPSDEMAARIDEINEAIADGRVTG